MTTIFFRIFIIILISYFSVAGYSQVNLSGKIINNKTNEAIPFANMIIEGTFTGCVSDIDGKFELKIPTKHINKKLRVSAIGFNTVYKSLKSIKEDIPFDIKMQPSSYALKNVEIHGVSRLQLTRIRRAINQIDENYIQEPFNYEFFFRNSQNNDKKIYEAVGTFYDSKGYKTSNPLNLFKERNYQFRNSRRNFTANSFSEHMHILDDILSMDIVRTSNNILNKNFLHLYELKLDKIVQHEGDSVWVIGYNHISPSIGTTGDYYVKSYKGKLYLKIKDYAVIKNELHVTSSNYSSLGRGYHITKLDAQKPTSVTYKVITDYKKDTQHYILDRISFAKEIIYNNKSEKSIADFIITKVEKKQPKEISNRTYFNKMSSDSSFWITYQPPL